MRGEVLPSIQKEIESLKWIELKNGDKRKMLHTEATAENYESIKIINDKVDKLCDYVQPLKDFSTVHKIFKRYKFYWWGLPVGAITLIATLWKIFTG